MTGRSGPAPRRNPIERALYGWQPARALMAATHLDFFTALGDEALPAEEVASRCNTHPRATRLLLNACVAMDVLEKKGDLYRNSEEARTYLVRGKPGYIALVPELGTRAICVRIGNRGNGVWTLNMAALPRRSRQTATDE